MSRRTVLITVASIALVPTALGVFVGQAVAKSGYWDSNPAAVTGTTAPGSAPKLTARELPQLGTTLTDQNGLTLYRFDKDTANPAKSSCDGDCAKKWPPMLATGTVSVDGVDQRQVGSVVRTDGTKQVTVGGWPVYRFAKDTAPGQTNGQGVGGTWFGVTPDGKKAGQNTGGGNEDNGDSGNQRVTQLIATNIDGIGPALTDQDGRTLYLFKKDTKKPPKSNCDGDCAQKWPPLLATGQIQVRGVDRDLVGTVTRSDGTKQVTVGGWPVYRFAKDTAAGQANGHGVMGTWFVIEPAGCASSAPPKAADQGNGDQGSGNQGGAGQDENQPAPVPGGAGY